jgi:hypothetical protein
MKYNCTTQTAQLQNGDRFVLTLPFELCEMKNIYKKWYQKTRKWPKEYWTNNDVENTTQKTEDQAISRKFDI